MRRITIPSQRWETEGAYVAELDIPDSEDDYIMKVNREQLVTLRDDIIEALEEIDAERPRL